MSDEPSRDGLEILHWDTEAAADALLEAVRSAIPRKGLTDQKRLELISDAERVASHLRGFRNATYRGAVIDLTMSALFVGLNAVFSAEQIASLRDAGYHEKQSKAATAKAQKSRASSAKRGHAQKIFSQLQSQGRLEGKRTNGIVTLILNEWNPNGLSAVVKCPDRTTVTGYVKDFLGEQSPRAR